MIRSYAQILMKTNTVPQIYITLLLIWVLSLTKPCPVQADPGTFLQDHGMKAEYGSPRMQYGGHLKVQGAVLWPDQDTVYHSVNTGPYQNGAFEGRLIHTVFFSENVSFDTHYEAVLSTGDTRELVQDLNQTYPGILSDALLPQTEPNDDHRLMSLSAIIRDESRDLVYHRLDRLFLTLNASSGTLRIGRQALTWGNGFLFNPMDLFNPFSPTDFERDYKVGDDMAHLQIPNLAGGECQLLYVPRRDPDTGDVGWDQASLAGKYHFSIGVTELDVITAHHYEDHVVGLGSRGYLADAAWRMDTTWTLTQDRSQDFLSIAANLDYSWTWWQKNFYGFMEFYFNGLGHSRTAAAYHDPWLIERIERGGLFTLGRHYLDAEIQVELHPLLKILVTGIYNIEDRSGIWQPRASWDLSESAQLIFGAEFFFGSSDTEFGGIKIPYTDMTCRASNRLYAWITLFF